MYGGIRIHVLCKDSKHHHYVGPACKLCLAACYEVTSDKVGTRCFGRCAARAKGLPVASLGACRQIYHEAKDVLYSAGDFTLDYPQLARGFIRRLDDVNNCVLAMRSVHLQVFVYDRNSEREWDNIFRVLAESWKNLRHIHIYVDEHIWNGDYSYFSRRKIPAQGKKPFLQGLLEFKVLPLTMFELVVSEHNSGRMADPYMWTNAQKRE